MYKFFIILFSLSLIYLNAFEVQTFGTLGLTYNDNEEYTFRKNTLQKYGSSKDISYEVDSLLGLQVSQTLSNNISIIAQGIYQQDYNGEETFDIDWAYIKYDNNDNYAFKIGRIRTPYYKNSDNLNIGISNLMVREPIEVYGQVPFSAYNGVEFSYSGIANEYFYEFQANYGEENFTAPIHTLNEEVEIELDKLYALNLTLGTSYLQFRVTYLNADISSSNDLLDNLFYNLEENGLEDIASEYKLDNKNSEYFGFGIFMEYNNFILNSEYGQRKVPSFYSDVRGYYLTLAYNYKDITPYISYAKSEMIQDLYANTGSRELNALLRVQDVSQNTKTIGMKYMYSKNIDFKIQYDHISPDAKWSSFYVSTEKAQSNLDVLTITMDFAF